MMMGNQIRSPIVVYSEGVKTHLSKIITKHFKKESMNIHEKELNISINLEVDDQTVTIYKKIPYEVLADALICNIKTDELVAFFRYVEETAGDLELSKMICQSFVELNKVLEDDYGNTYKNL
jgi:hypothetical protein